MGVGSYLSRWTPSNPKIFLLKVLPICLTKDREELGHMSKVSKVFLNAWEINVTIVVTKFMIMITSYS